MTEKCFEERFRDVEENYKVITNRIAEAAVRSGRKPEDITFLAATKTVPAEVINHAIGCGLRFIGENRVQEFMDKDRLGQGRFRPDHRALADEQGEIYHR